MAVRNSIKRAWFEVYKLALRAGVVLLPNHYYADSPDINELTATRDIWARASAMIGVDSPIDCELACLTETCEPFIQEIATNPIYESATRNAAGPGFGYIEAQVLHCFLRRFQPARIVEVGSGVSTQCALHAISLNRRQSELICIEPNPRAWLTSERRVRLIAREVQSMPVEFFEQLVAGDFLFIDSSHAVKTGSDVNYLVLEVLPRLAAGVYVHFHDITFPYDYSPDTLRSFLHPQETALLHAFLIGNRRMRVMFSLSRLHHEKPAVLARAIPGYRPMKMKDGLSESEGTGHFPSSLYLRVI